MRGHEVPMLWSGVSVSAWLPDPVRDAAIALSTRAAQDAERAAAELRVADARLPAGWEPIGRLMLRSEGIASS